MLQISDINEREEKSMKKNIIFLIMIITFLFGINVVGENGGCYEQGYPAKGLYLNGQERTKVVPYDENIHDIDPMVIGSWGATIDILEVFVFFEDGAVFLVTRAGIGGGLTLIYNGYYRTEDGNIYITYEDVQFDEVAYEFYISKEGHDLFLELVDSSGNVIKYENLANQHMSEK